jgi:hypothetical protein
LQIPWLRKTHARKTHAAQAHLTGFHALMERAAASGFFHGPTANHGSSHFASDEVEKIGTMPILIQAAKFSTG